MSLCCRFPLLALKLTPVPGTRVIAVSKTGGVGNAANH